MTQPEQPQRIPIQVQVGVVDGVRPAQIAITFATGNTQFTLITDTESAEQLPVMMGSLIGQALPHARAVSSGLILPGQSINGHQPPQGPAS